MRRVAYSCPCGGEICLNGALGVTEESAIPPLTCISCGAIFEKAPPLIMVKRGRDDSVQEGTPARILTQVIDNGNKPQRVAETTR